jgi:hypothetical protein
VKIFQDKWSEFTLNEENFSGNSYMIEKNEANPIVQLAKTGNKLIENYSNSKKTEIENSKISKAEEEKIKE